MHYQCYPFDKQGQMIPMALKGQALNNRETGCGLTVALSYLMCKTPSFKRAETPADALIF